MPNAPAVQTVTLCMPVWQQIVSAGWQNCRRALRDCRRPCRHIV